MKQIIITFNGIQPSTFETIGFSGDSCKTETEAIKRALGETLDEVDRREDAGYGSTTRRDVASTTVGGGRG